MLITESMLEESKKAPRVTLAQLEENIASEHYFTASDGVYGAMERGEDGLGMEDPSWIHLGLMTFCVLVLKNGFVVTGESACASPENFNQAIGRELSRKQAIGKVWMLMGYELKSKLAEAKG